VDLEAAKTDREMARRRSQTAQTADNSMRELLTAAERGNRDYQAMKNSKDSFSFY